jgi:hypothetical protein
VCHVFQCCCYCWLAEPVTAVVVWTRIGLEGGLREALWVKKKSQMILERWEWWTRACATIREQTKHSRAQGCRWREDGKRCGVTVDIVVSFAHVAMSVATTKSQYSQGYYCCNSFGVMFNMICDVRYDERFALLCLPYLSSLASDDLPVTSTQHRVLR